MLRGGGGGTVLAVCVEGGRGKKEELCLPSSNLGERRERPRETTLTINNIRKL